jgi:hypothetical protein
VPTPAGPFASVTHPSHHDESVAVASISIRRCYR